MRRRIPRRAVAVLLLTLSATLAGAGEAAATPAAPAVDLPGLPGLPGLPDTGCDGPVPAMPSRGGTSWLLPEPDSPPPAEDPFKPGATTTLYEQYGFAGLNWHACDVRDGVAGVLPDAASEANITTTVANWGLGLAKIPVALYAALTTVSLDTSWLTVFTPLLTNGTQALYESLVQPWAPVILTIVVVMLLWGWRNLSLGAALTKVGQVALILLAVAAVLGAPVQIANLVNSFPPAIIGGVANSVNSRVDGAASQLDPSMAAISAAQESLLYHQWLAGMFGSATSPTAERFGPQLFQAGAFNRAEQAEYYRHVTDGDQDAANDMIKDKRDEYHDVMAELEDADPAAYEYATGRTSEGRIWGAFAANLGAWLTLPFLIAGSLVIIASYLVVIGALIWFVGQAILGTISPGFATGPIGVAVGASFTAVLTGIAVNLDIMATRIILDPATGLPFWMKVLLAAVAAWVAWLAIRPFRAIGRMTGANQTKLKKYARKGYKKGRKAGKRQVDLTKAEVRNTRDAVRGDLDAHREERLGDAEEDLPYGAGTRRQLYGAPARAGATAGPPPAAKRPTVKRAEPTRTAKKTAAKKTTASKRAPAKKATAPATKRAATNQSGNRRPPVVQAETTGTYTVFDGKTFETRSRPENAQKGQQRS